MTDWLTRRATPADAPGILAVFNPIIEAGIYTVFDAPFSIEAEREYIANQHPRGLFHVATHPVDGVIVGFQSMEPFATYTKAFDHVGTVGTYVDLNRHRQGIAAALFRVTFEAARHRGYEKLFTFVRADNLAAQATYLRHGFTIVGAARRQARINGQYVDELMIEKFL